MKRISIVVIVVAVCSTLVNNCNAKAVLNLSQCLNRTSGIGDRVFMNIRVSHYALPYVAGAITVLRSTASG